MGGLQFLQQGDAITRTVALLLLCMSVASWVVIVWKAWLLRRAAGDVARSTAAFWQAASVNDAEQNIKAFDRSALVLPLLIATKSGANGAWTGSLAGAADRSQQLGERFSLREFHDTFLAAGRLPIALIRYEMTGLDDEVALFWKTPPIPQE